MNDLPDNELIALARELAQIDGVFGAGELPREEALQIAKEWLNKNKPKLCNIFCKTRSISLLIYRRDCVELAKLVADIEPIFPSITLCSLVVKAGRESFCQAIRSD